MRELVEFLARNLVDEPEAVQVDEVDSGRVIVYELQVAERDEGKVIGREGKVIRAIRTLTKAGAARRGQRVDIDVVYLRPTSWWLPGLCVPTGSTGRCSARSSPSFRPGSAPRAGCSWAIRPIPIAFGERGFAVECCCLRWRASPRPSKPRRCAARRSRCRSKRRWRSHPAASTGTR